jgi:hypothetical protein
MARLALLAGVLAALLTPCRATTLEQLSLDDMIAKSTAIVRGRVVSSQTSLHNSLIYTHFSIQVLERWKGPEGASVDVAVPGGVYRGLRQSFPGTPALSAGSEYVLFLWTGKSGVTQVIGLSQGALNLGKDDKGNVVVSRAALGEPLLDPKSGQKVDDAGLLMRFSDLSGHISAALARGAR